MINTDAACPAGTSHRGTIGQALALAAMLVLAVVLLAIVARFQPPSTGDELPGNDTPHNDRARSSLRSATPASAVLVLLVDSASGVHQSLAQADYRLLYGNGEPLAITTLIVNDQQQRARLLADLGTLCPDLACGPIWVVDATR